MSDSLLFGSLELIDGFDWDGTGSTPYLAGADSVPEDLGAPLPDTATIIGLLDGDQVTGKRSGNRQITLPVLVAGTSQTDAAAKVNALLAILDQQSFTLTWTPDGGLPVIYDGRRGSWTRARQFERERVFYRSLTLVFPALPFGRSDEQETFTVPATGGASPVQVDGMNSGSFTAGSLDTGTKFEGAGSCFLTGIIPKVGGRTISSTDLSNYATVGIRVRAASNTINTSVTLQLTDNASTTVGVQVTSLKFAAGAWTLVQFPLASFTGVDLTQVTKWQVTIVSGSGHPNFNVDDLRAFPPGSVGNSTTEGTVLTVPGVLGSARTPVALSLTRGGSVLANALIHSPPSSQDHDLTILAGLSAGAVTVPAENMNYATDPTGSTYSCLVAITSSASGDRTITATFTQKVGATTVATQAISVDVTGTQTIVTVGNIALPLVAFPTDNTNGSLVIAITQTGGSGSDTYSDVALCDTKGQTVLLTGLTSVESIWIDEPDPTVDVGQIYTSTGTTRANAISAMGSAIGAAAILLEPGSNKILALSTSGAPDLSGSYYPRWQDERDQ